MLLRHVDIVAAGDAFDGILVVGHRSARVEEAENEADFREDRGSSLCEDRRRLLAHLEVDALAGHLLPQGGREADEGIAHEASHDRRRVVEVEGLVHWFSCRHA